MKWFSVEIQEDGSTLHYAGWPLQSQEKIEIAFTVSWIIGMNGKKQYFTQLARKRNHF